MMATKSRPVVHHSQPLTLRVCLHRTLPKGAVGDDVVFQGCFHVGTGKIVDTDGHSRTIETEHSYFFQVWTDGKVWVDTGGIKQKRQRKWWSDDVLNLRGPR